MFKRKLEALNYHSVNDFNPNDEKHFRSLVLWLEDQVIRHYKIEDREELRKIDSPKWRDAFENYCTDLHNPIHNTSNIEKLEWLLGFAVRLVYEDNLEKYKNLSAENVKNTKNETPLVKSTNPLDNLDFQCSDFENGVNELAKILKVSQHPDHLVTLQAVSSVVAQGLEDNNSKEILQGAPFPIMESDLGFDLGDYVLNQAAKVLRLLYIHDLRDLQTKINESIVAVQSITADPKTDTSLGKVGY